MPSWRRGRDWRRREVDFGGGAEEKRGAESNDEDWNGDGEEVLVEICMQFVSSLPCDD